MTIGELITRLSIHDQSLEVRIAWHHTEPTTPLGGIMDDIVNKKTHCVEYDCADNARKCCLLWAGKPGDLVNDLVEEANARASDHESPGSPG